MLSYSLQTEKNKMNDYSIDFLVKFTYILFILEDVKNKLSISAWNV